MPNPTNITKTPQGYYSYGGENFVYLDNITPQRSGKADFYQTGDLAGFYRNSQNLMVIQETRGQKDIVRTTQTKVPADSGIQDEYFYSADPQDTLELDLGTMPAGVEFNIRKIEGVNNKGQVAGGDLAIDIYLPLANSRKTIVMKDQFDPKNTGAGIESIQISTNYIHPDYPGQNSSLTSSTSLINSYNYTTGENLIPSKRSFEEIKADFERALVEVGGEIWTGPTLTELPNASIYPKQMGEAAKLAQKAFAKPQDGEATLDPSQGGKLQKAVGGVAP